MMPIILTIIGCVLGAGLVKSLKAGLWSAFLSALTLVINQLFGTAIGPAVQEMIHRFGLTSTSSTSVGQQVQLNCTRHHHWPGYHSLALIVNLFLSWLISLRRSRRHLELLALRIRRPLLQTSLTSCLASLQQSSTRSSCCSADATAMSGRHYQHARRFYLLPGLLAAYAPVAMGSNWLIDKIPAFATSTSTLSFMQKRFGVFGEPLFIGTVIGLIIGRVVLRRC